MFRSARTVFARRSVRRAIGASASTFTGVGLTTSVALAKAPGPDPLKIEPSEISTGVPKLTPRDSSEVSAVELEPPQQERRAYNPETGEIDWDCPCLGGMAHGPCGEEFKAAFSCFVYSKEEIKGSECIPKFSAMQNCFRKYPEVYADFQDDENVETARSSDADAAAGAVAPVKEKATDLSNKAAKNADKVAENTNKASDNAKENAKKTAHAASDRANELADNANATVQGTADRIAKAKESAQAKGNQYWDSAKSGAQDSKDRLSDGAESIKDSVAQTAESGKTGVQKTTQSTQESAQSAKDQAVKTAQSAADTAKQTANYHKDNSTNKVQDAAKNSFNQVADAKDDSQYREKEMISQLKLDDKVKVLEKDLGKISNESKDKSAGLLEKLDPSEKDSELVSLSKGTRENVGNIKRQVRGFNDKAYDALEDAEHFVTDAVAGVTAEAQDAVQAVSDRFK